MSVILLIVLKGESTSQIGNVLQVKCMVYYCSATVEKLKISCFRPDNSAMTTRYCTLKRFSQSQWGIRTVINQVINLLRSSSDEIVF